MCAYWEVALRIGPLMSSQLNVMLGGGGWLEKMGHWGIVFSHPLFTLLPLFTLSSPILCLPCHSLSSFPQLSSARSLCQVPLPWSQLIMFYLLLNLCGMV